MLNSHQSTETKSRLIARATAYIAMTGWLIPTLAVAQSTITPSYLPQKQEVLHLDKFEVNGKKDDQSYAIQRSFTATKTDTALVDVPQAITVITSDLIEDQGMRGIGDVTRYVPGAGIAQGEGNRDTPVLRGNSTTADFFIDGIRDDVQYFRDLYNVDRVEVLKGPNAMIFGRGGSGGLINRVTKQANGSTQREIKVQTGSWNQYRATLDLAAPIDRSLAFRVTGLHEDGESYRDGVTLTRSGINPTLSWVSAAGTTLRVGYEYFHDDRVADRGISSFQGRPVATDASTFFGDPSQSYAEVKVNTFFATLDHKISSQINLRNNTRFSSYDKVYQNVYPGAVNTAGTDVSISAYRNATTRDNLINQTDLVYAFEVGSVKHQVLAGMEFARQATDNERKTGYFTTISPTTTSVLATLTNPRVNLPLTFRPSATDANNHGIAQTVAFYAQDQITLLPELQAIIGLRWESFDIDFLNNRTAQSVANTDHLVSPRAGLLFKPVDDISFYTSYSTSYIPRAGEQLTSLNLTNRSLDPEEFINYEIGLKWDIRSDLAFTAALYRLDRTNVAISDPADPTKSLLVDGQRTAGLELGLTGRITRSWSLSGGYAYQSGEIKTTQSATIVSGARLAQLPRHTFSLWNRYDLNQQWGIGVGAIYRDEICANIDNKVVLPAFTRIDAAIFYRISKNVRAQLNAENLFDRAYFASAHNNNNITPGSPRGFRVSLSTTF